MGEYPGGQPYHQPPEGSQPYYQQQPGESGGQEYYRQPPPGQQKGFFGSLFDVGFNHYATPSVVPVLYVLVLIVAALEAIVLLFVGFATLVTAPNMAIALLGLLWLIGAVLAPLITVTLYRLVLEFFVVQFRILDAVRDLRR